MKDKKQTRKLKGFVRRSLLTLSALSLLSGVMPSSGTLPTGTGSSTHSRVLSSSGNILTDAGRSMTSLLGSALSASGFAPLTAYAATWPTPDFAVESEGAILIDADSGAVLYEKNATTAYYPASITKVMSLYLLFEQLERGLLAARTPVPNANGTGVRRLPSVIVLLSDGKNTSGTPCPVVVARAAGRAAAGFRYGDAAGGGRTPGGKRPSATGSRGRLKRVR